MNERKMFKYNPNINKKPAIKRNNFALKKNRFLSEGISVDVDHYNKVQQKYGIKNLMNKSLQPKRKKEVYNKKKLKRDIIKMKKEKTN